MIRVFVRLLVPAARRWVDRQEAAILAGGVGLTRTQHADAVRAGVRRPSAVRLMRVRAIPRPFDPVLRPLGRWLPLISEETAGMALGHGVVIREPWWNDRTLLVHELVHVAQYERFGSTAAFLTPYLFECLAPGYPNGPLEQEAIRLAASVCALPAGET